MHIQIKTMACRWGTIYLSTACIEVNITGNTTCCCSPASSGIALQRRCYWLLDGDDGTVLVHYLASKKLGRSNSDPRCQSESMLPHFWDTARVDDYETSPYPHKAQRCYHGGLQDTCMNFEQVLSLWDSQFIVVLLQCLPMHRACCTLCQNIQA